MNRELCIQLELFSNPTLNDNEGELIYQISELLILVVRLDNE